MVMRPQDLMPDETVDQAEVDEIVAKIEQLLIESSSRYSGRWRGEPPLSITSDVLGDDFHIRNEVIKVFEQNGWKLPSVFRQVAWMIVTSLGWSLVLSPRFSRSRKRRAVGRSRLLANGRLLKEVQSTTKSHRFCRACS